MLFVLGKLSKHLCKMLATFLMCPWLVSISSWDSLIIIFTLLNTDLVPTKKLPVLGLVPHTIAGEPSNLTDNLPLEVNHFNTVKSPVKTESSGWLMCVFFILIV